MNLSLRLWGKIVLIFFLSSFLHPGLLLTQMVDPDIDKPDEPFSYFAYPVDVLGIADGREGTEVTPEGYLYTGYGELVFFCGSPPRPVNQRIKTLYRGHFPIIQYSFIQDEVQYSVTLFAFTLDGTPESELVNFIRVQFENLGQVPRTVYWWIGSRYTAESSDARGLPDHRFRRPAEAPQPGFYEQAGEDFSPDWEYAFGQGMMLRAGKIFYFYPPDMTHSEWITLKTPYNEDHKKSHILPTTPVGLVKYEILLKPEEKKSIDFKMPYKPLSQEDDLVETVKQARFDDYFQETIDFWEFMFSQGMNIRLSEDKVVDTFNVSLVYDLIARDKIRDDYIQKVNEFQYDAFWLRDSAYIVRAYDVTGYPKISEQCLNFFLNWQREDGNFISQRGQYDGWGQALWAIGQHFQMTRDLEFAKRFFPAVEKAIHWLSQARSGDPLHIMPVTTPGDNELISGHITGHNFWALGGLKSAIEMAEGLGKTEEARLFRQEYGDYFKHFSQALEMITKKTDGYIPPGLDESGGQDWGNLMAVYPVQILEPMNPLVTKTLEVSRAKYKEGIMTYGDGRWLHLYLTMKNTETLVIRGEQKKALEEFYSILLHTSSTHAGFEYTILPWGDRDFQHNLSPHGWFAAKFRTLLRNMLVREEGETLHLCSVLSPSWLREGQRIDVSKAPTPFGSLDFSFAAGKEAGRLTLKPEFRDKPKEIILHLPWFVEVSGVLVDGKKHQTDGHLLRFSPDTQEVVIQWERKLTGAMNYDLYVQEYKEKYKAKYKEFLEKGEARNK